MSKNVNYKTVSIALGILFLLLFLSFYMIYRGLSVDQYPKLNSCIKASVSKKTLCSSASDYVRLESISKNVINSIIISEDDKFYFHKGFDWKELKSSIVANLRAFSFVRGGSTITQQLVKNVYLSQEKSLTRKIKEAILASQIENRYSKSLILEKYLNAIEFGPDVWGIKKASSHYFSKSASELTALEGAYLATLLPSPKRYSQSFTQKELTPYLKKRMKHILYWQMRKGQIDETIYELALENIDFFPWVDIPLIEPEFYDFEEADADEEVYDLEEDSEEDSKTETTIEEPVVEPEKNEEEILETEPKVTVDTPEEVEPVNKESEDAEDSPGEISE